MSTTTNDRAGVGVSRRKFNKLVSNPVFEDYSLRYAPKSFRTWSQYAVFSAALGGIAYLADQFGCENAFWGILAAATIIFLTGIPIAYYCAKYNVDVDLLTRGAGFGYLGSNAACAATVSKRRTSLSARPMRRRSARSAALWTPVATTPASLMPATPCN